MKLEADARLSFPRESVFRAYRDHLVDLVGGLGVTDPVSGEVILDLKP